MRLIIVVCSIAVAIITGGALLDYLTGRTFSIAIGNFLPAVVAGAALIIICWITALLEIVRKKPHGWPLLTQLFCIAVSIFLCLGIFAFCLHFRPYLLGLRDGVFAAGTPDEFRKAAQVIIETFQPDAPPFEFRSSLPGPGKWSIWKEERDRPRWNELIKRAPCIARISSSVWIFRNEGYVSFTWGGALAGHSGFSVGPNAPGGESETFRYSNDIVFWMGQ